MAVMSFLTGETTLNLVNATWILDQRTQYRYQIEQDVLLLFGTKNINPDKCFVSHNTQGWDPIIRPSWLEEKARLGHDGICTRTIGCQTTQKYYVHVESTSIRTHLPPDSMYWYTHDLSTVCKSTCAQTHSTFTKHFTLQNVRKLNSWYHIRVQINPTLYVGVSSLSRRTFNYQTPEVFKLQDLMLESSYALQFKGCTGSITTYRAVLNTYIPTTRFREIWG